MFVCVAVNMLRVVRLIATLVSEGSGFCGHKPALTGWVINTVRQTSDWAGHHNSYFFFFIYFARSFFPFFCFLNLIGAILQDQRVELGQNSFCSLIAMSYQVSMRSGPSRCCVCFIVGI